MTRTQVLIVPFLISLPLMIAVPGCNSANEEMTNTEPVPAQTGGENTAGDTAAGVNAIDSPSTKQQEGALGNEHPAGPFRVTLTTAKTPPAVGDTVFTARVTREGVPVQGANVNLKLSMPTMNMDGPEIPLTSTGPVYTGMAPLSMAGAWTAVVSVSSGGETGHATYVFNIPG